MILYEMSILTWEVYLWLVIQNGPILSIRNQKPMRKGARFLPKLEEIAVAVKEGGGSDPNTNSRLKDVIAKARANNMPNDNIMRSIKKAAGEGIPSITKM